MTLISMHCIGHSLTEKQMVADWKPGRAFWTVAFPECMCLKDLRNRMNLQKFVIPMVLFAATQI